MDSEKEEKYTQLPFSYERKNSTLGIFIQNVCKTKKIFF